MLTAALRLLTVAAFVIADGMAINCYMEGATTTPGNGVQVSCLSASCYSCYSSFTAHFSSGCATDFLSQSCLMCSTDYCNTATPSSISCYSRSSQSANGIVTACQTGVSTCFSVHNDQLHSNIWYPYIAGCGACNSTTHPSCVNCNTNNCNTVTPSSISCYNRDTNYISYDKANGTEHGKQEACDTGITTCYSYIHRNIPTSTSFGPKYYGGCGDCSAMSQPSCATCSTSLCNTLTPSAISCYTRYSPNSRDTYNGFGITCHKGISSCYSTSSNNGTPYVHQGGCGSCSSNADPSCVTCSTSFCNTQTPSSISCYGDSTATQLTCPTGISTCYTLKFTSNSTGGCGSCSGVTSGECTQCNSNYCNTPASSSNSGAAAVTGANMNTAAAAAAAGLGMLLLMKPL